MKNRILQNEIKCLKCGDCIYSSHTHDFKTCSCGAVSVDGGMGYLRRVGKLEDYEDLSIVIPEDTYQAMNKGLDWAKENNRNNLGTVCAIARALRNEGYDVSKLFSKIEQLFQ